MTINIEQLTEQYPLVKELIELKGLTHPLLALRKG